MRGKMKAKRFEDLIVWQKSRNLVNIVYQITNNSIFKDSSLKDQIRHAAVSVMSNIAEGFERGTREDLIHFLYIARASCGEVRAQNYISFDQKYISRYDFEKLQKECEIVSSMLYKFIESVKVSEFKGLKFKKFNKNQEEFDKYLQSFLKDKK
jgi:four helix bundle protein